MHRIYLSSGHPEPLSGSTDLCEPLSKPQPSVWVRGSYLQQSIRLPTYWQAFCAALGLLSVLCTPTSTSLTHFGTQEKNLAPLSKPPSNVDFIDMDVMF